MQWSDGDTTAPDATSLPDGSSDSVGTSTESPAERVTSALTPLCGAHCGLKDKHVGHCDVCHMLNANFVKVRDNHLRGGNPDDKASERRRNGTG